MSATAKPHDPDYQLNTLTDMVRIVGETRSDVKILDRKVDCNQQENRERFDRIEQKFEAQLDQLEQKFDARLDQVEQKFDARLDQLELLIRQLLPNASN